MIRLPILTLLALVLVLLTGCASPEREKLPLTEGGPGMFEDPRVMAAPPPVTGRPSWSHVAIEVQVAVEAMNVDVESVDGWIFSGEPPEDPLAEASEGSKVQLGKDGGELKLLSWPSHHWSLIRVVYQEEGVSAEQYYVQTWPRSDLQEKAYDFL